jgi:putative oxidoreductase
MAWTNRTAAYLGERPAAAETPAPLPTPPDSATRVWHWYVPAVGRILLSAIFLLSGTMKLLNWEGTAEYMAGHGMPMVQVLLAAAIFFELAGGLSVLLGYYTRLGALALTLFLIPATLTFHDFWNYEGLAQQGQMQHFLKNVAIMGGLIILACQGPGGCSLDHRRARQG